MRGPGRVCSVSIAHVLAVRVCFPGAAAADRPYRAIFNENHSGDITGTGNTLLSRIALTPSG